MISTHFHSSHSKTTPNHHLVVLPPSKMCKTTEDSFSLRFVCHCEAFQLARGWAFALLILVSLVPASQRFRWNGVAVEFFFRLRIAQNKHESFLIFHFIRLHSESVFTFSLARKKLTFFCYFQLKSFFIANTSQTLL